MRAPPEAAKHTKGACRRIASSTAREKRSPTTLPMEPAWKRNSKAVATIGWLRSVPDIAMSASVSPEAASAAAMRFGYGLLSTKPSGSTLRTLAAISTALSGSRKARRRWRAPMR